MKIYLVAGLVTGACLCWGVTNAPARLLPLQPITGTTAWVDAPCDVVETNAVPQPAATPAEGPATNAPPRATGPEAPVVKPEPVEVETNAPPEKVEPQKEATGPSTEPEAKAPEVLESGTLRALSRPDNPHTRPAEHGSVTTLRESSGDRVGSANTYDLGDGNSYSVIRDDKGHKAGSAVTYDTEIGRKTVLRDEDGNRVGSVHRVEGNTVYRDANNKRLTRKEAREAGLR